MKKVACVLISSLVLLAGCGDQDSQAKKVTAYEKGDYEGRIAEWVLRDYSDESLIHGSDDDDGPSTSEFSPLVEKINQQKIEASKHALDYGGCDVVESASFYKEESRIDNLVYMIDCSNGRRLHVSSSDLSTPTPLRSDAEKAMPQGRALELCKKMIEGELPAKASVDYHELIGMSYYKAPTSGNVKLSLDFDVIVTPELKQKFAAECYFESSGGSSISISAR